MKNRGRLEGSPVEGEGGGRFGDCFSKAFISFSRPRFLIFCSVLSPKKKEAGRPPECSFLLIYEIEISQDITNFHHHIKT